jgi:hypothetical protein
MEAQATLCGKTMGVYVVPALGDFLADLTCDVIVGAEILESLPPPPRSLTATMPWNPDSGVGKHGNKLVRALYALPLLFILYGAGQTMGRTAQSFLPPLVKGSQTSQLQLIYCKSKYLRKCHPLTLNRPTILGVLYQLRGIGYIAPIYFFLHYVQSPLENYHAADNRLTQIGPVKTIIPAIILSYVLPSVTMFLAPGLATRQWVNGLFWQPFPIYATILQRVLPRFVTDTTYEDRISKLEADMPYLRRIYGFAGVAAACAYLYVRFNSPVSLTEVFFKGVSNPSEVVPLAQALTKFLRYDQIAAFSASTVWAMLSFRDLKRGGKVTTSWSKIVGAYAGITLVAGPGAALSAMWA